MTGPNSAQIEPGSQWLGLAKWTDIPKEFFAKPKHSETLNERLSQHYRYCELADVGVSPAKAATAAGRTGGFCGRILSPTHSEYHT